MSLRKNISWTFCGNAIYSVCQWGILIILAKISSPEAVGQYSLGLAVSGPVYSFFNLQLRVIQATDTKNEFHFSDYLGLRICTTLASILLIITLSFFSSDKSETILVIIIIGFAKAMESMSDIIYGFFQKYEHMDKISISLIIKGILAFIFIFISMYITKSIIIASFSLFCSWLLLFLIYDLNKLKKLHTEILKQSFSFPLFNINILKQIIILAIPMGIVIMLNTFNMNIPRYLIVHFYDETILGYYSAISYLIILGTTIVNAIGQSVVPRLAKYYLNNLKDYKLLLYKVLYITIIISSIGVLFAYYFGEFILTILYNKDYAKFSDVFLWIMISGSFLFCSSMIGCAITAARSFWSQCFIGCIVCITIGFSTYYLIPIYGMVGGAMSLSIGFFVKLIIQLILILNLLKADSNKKICIKK